MEFIKLSCEEFTERLASSAPTPGGGGACAVVAAIGVALGDMVGSLTMGKKRYAGVSDDIAALKAKALKLRINLLECAQKDAEAFESLLAAYRSKDQEIIESALIACCEVPLGIMRKCCDAIDMHGEFLTKGAQIAVSDVGCGVICCKAALRAASLNVFVNVKTMRDRDMAERYNRTALDMLDVYNAKAEDIFSLANEKLF
ncbi:MAG: cyclodeaminase/cyclohydrolase family protein [Clostridiales bacterium]|jgi:formiminotetrahydrofolate cyclodeaminase|nr:cyclodeaminase/cyclohydrolase family protein [Clostridiales bacterium]